MESEFIALDTTCSEAEWLKDLLSEFSIVPRPILPISVHTNSRSTIEILNQDNANKKMNRYIQIRLKSVQHLLGKVVLLNLLTVDCLKITEDKSSENRVYTQTRG